MTTELKDRFLVALRSGDYARGEGNFKMFATPGQPPCWCAFGVLLDVWGKGEWQPMAGDEKIMQYAYSGEPYWAWPSRKMERALGMTSEQVSGLIRTSESGDALTEPHWEDVIAWAVENL
jgi:hypothetical protein